MRSIKELVEEKVVVQVHNEEEWSIMIGLIPKEKQIPYVGPRCIRFHLWHNNPLGQGQRSYYESNGFVVRDFSDYINLCNYEIY